MDDAIKAADAFSAQDLDRIAAAIGEVEKKTSAEIRVSIRDQRNPDEAGLTITDLAHKEFFALGMEKTAGRSGILLLLLFEEQLFYVYGDEGIHARTDVGTWQDVADTMAREFRVGEFGNGIVKALHALVPHVQGVFPRSDDDVDELSNEVVIR